MNIQPEILVQNTRILIETKIDVSSIPLSILQPVRGSWQTKGLTLGINKLSAANILTVADFANYTYIDLWQSLPGFGIGAYQAVCDSIDQYFESFNIDLTFAQIYHYTHLNKALQNKSLSIS